MAKFSDNITGKIIEAITKTDINGEMVAVIKLDEFLENYDLVVDLKDVPSLKPLIKKQNKIKQKAIINYDHDENRLADYTN
jgi:hypothetical protein